MERKVARTVSVGETPDSKLISYRKKDTGEVVMSYTQQKGENGYTFFLQGALLSDVAFDILDELGTLAMFHVPIVLDFAKVTYISNAVQNSLMKVQKEVEEYNTTMYLRNLPDAIAADLEKTGVIDLLNVEQ